MNIVLIDDEIDHLESTSSVFELLGHKVEKFRDIEIGKALRYLEKNYSNIDFVFIDQNMPSKLGTDLGKEIFQNDYSNYLVCVLLTIVKELDIAIKALTECGFSYFISKNDFISKEQFEEKIKFMQSLPSVKTKRELNKSIAFFDGQYPDEEILGVEARLDCIEKFLAYLSPLADGIFDQAKITCAINYCEKLIDNKLNERTKYKKETFSWKKLSSNSEKYVSGIKKDLLEILGDLKLTKLDISEIWQMWQNKNTTSNPAAIYFRVQKNIKKLNYLIWKCENSTDPSGRWRKDRWTLVFEHYEPVKKIVQKFKK